MIVILARYASIVMALGISAGSAFGYLKIHPTDPHYLQETTTEEAVMITSFTNIVPNEAGYDDQTTFRLDTQRWRMMYVRSWHFTPWSVPNAIWPWASSGVAGGYWGGYGGNKLDLNTWNPTAWTRHKDSIDRAENARVYVQIMLFDRCGMSPGTDSRWGGNPWAANNNINNLEVPNANPPNDGTPDFYYYASKPNLRNQQERYVRKMIDETITYSNVIYEIENEHWEHNDPDWANHYGQFIKNYIAANYPSSPRLVSYSSLESDLEDMYSSSYVDIVNKHYGSTAETTGTINAYIEPRWAYNKPINIDEFANGLTDTNILREMCWETITSGGHFHIEDANSTSSPHIVVDNINRFKNLANWNFVGAAPNKNLIASGGGFCLANVGEEYVCYFYSGGSKTVNLAPGTYRSQWWNPRTGGFYNITNFSHSGGNRSFSTPDGNDWVLHITTRPILNTELDSRPAGTVTIDGNTNDWNLTTFNTKIFGGDAGKGDTAIIGYNGYQNWTCYKGGHYTDGQFPPENAADHAAQVYAQDDAGFLYFLLRMEDSDIRTPNGTDTNWANDCVEFYIDPGNDGGANPLSNSNSDIQLVIDAANRKNVYMTTSGYKTQVLNGVISATSTDANGWWLEVRIDKSALDPDIPANAGTSGLDFVFRDNDANNSALTTIYSWTDQEVSNSFPTKIPDRWGKLNLNIALPVLGDFDGDKDVDQEDFGHIQTCYSGDGVPYRDGCQNTDLQGDGDVDQDDFNIFVVCMNGANNPSGC
ncbi:MAG: sugar-binding protein [Planctomycetota bacterium]|jgi:hypothetical protein